MSYFNSRAKDYHSVKTNTTTPLPVGEPSLRKGVLKNFANFT